MPEVRQTAPLRSAGGARLRRLVVTLRYWVAVRGWGPEICINGQLGQQR